MWWGRGTDRESEDPYYDLFEDFDLIVSSFQAQYGLRLSRDIQGMKWDEFAALLSGLDAKTPLGQIVSIRAEDDREILKTFSPAQKRIRSQYRNGKVKRMPQTELDAALNLFKNAFIAMAK